MSWSTRYEDEKLVECTANNTCSSASFVDVEKVICDCDRACDSVTFKNVDELVCTSDMFDWNFGSWNDYRCTGFKETDINNVKCIVDLNGYYENNEPKLYDYISSNSNDTELKSASIGSSEYTCLENDHTFTSMIDFDFVSKCNDDGDECRDCEPGERCGYIGYQTETIQCRGSCFCLTEPFCPTTLLQVGCMTTPLFLFFSVACAFVFLFFVFLCLFFFHVFFNF